MAQGHQLGLLFLFLSRHEVEDLLDQCLLGVALPPGDQLDLPLLMKKPRERSGAKERAPLWNH